MPPSSQTWNAVNCPDGNSYGPISERPASDQLRRWAEHWPAQAREFRCAFSCRHGGEVEHWWAVGRDAEIRVHVDEQGLSFEFARHGRIQLTDRLPHGSDETPYPLMFEHLGEFRRRAAALLNREMNSEVVFLGGWRALMRPGRRQEIARFTVPHRWARRTDEPSPQGSGESPSSVSRPASARSISSEFLAASLVGQFPEQSHYTRGLTAVLDELRDGRLRKLVVARKVGVRLSRLIEPLELLQRLESRGYGEVYSYLFQWDDEDAWIGVSPEMLLMMSGDRYRTRILAGTRPNPCTVQRLDDLLNDSKEDLEHRAAVELMMRDLTKVSRPGSVHCGVKEIWQLKYAAHLQTAITGTVGPDVDVFDVLGAIYPPATIWGAPRPWAGRRIAALESFERGYYSGGLGYVTGDGQANFALAIRTAVLRRELLDVFAGSGIVTGADPGQEWEETAAKMHPFLSLLNGGAVSP